MPILHATNVTQYLTSPDFPQKYPSGIRCSWVIFNDDFHYKSIYLKFLRFDLIGSDSDEYDSRACNKDRVEITENNVCYVVSKICIINCCLSFQSDLNVAEGLGSTVIYNEKHAIYGVKKLNKQQ